jgi:hypothetical protein
MKRLGNVSANLRQSLLGNEQKSVRKQSSLGRDRKLRRSVVELRRSSVDSSKSRRKLTLSTLNFPHPARQAAIAKVTNAHPQPLQTTLPTSQHPVTSERPLHQ